MFQTLSLSKLPYKTSKTKFQAHSLLLCMQFVWSNVLKSSFYLVYSQGHLSDTGLQALTVPQLNGYPTERP